METKSAFDRLIRDLSQTERLNMLEKIKQIIPINDKPLKTEIDEEEYDHVKSYSTFSFIEKIIIFFSILFSANDKEYVIENLSLEKLARKIEKFKPMLINYNKNFFNGILLTEILKLKESMKIFRKSLSDILNTAETDFIAFLVGMHFPEIEAKLLKDIDPVETAKNMDFENSFQIKRHIEFRIDENLGEIDADKKKIIYKEIQNLHVLNSLAQFNFEKITAAFVDNPEYGGLSCSFSNIRKPLHHLFDILSSLNVSPSTDTLEALFMFGNEISHPDVVYPLEELLKSKLLSANSAFDVIRNFNADIPLQSILKLINRNMNYQPSKTGGAEDWYALFRRFWYKRFDLLMEEYLDKEKKNMLVESAVVFLGAPAKPSLKYYRNGLWGNSVEVQFEICAGFIESFMSGIFNRELVKALKLVLIDGQFYKEQNRLDYNESYKIVTETAAELMKIDNKLSPGGEYCQQIDKIKASNKDEFKKIEDIKNVISTADNDIQILISKYNAALYLLINVISGIVQGDMGGVYDTLSNLGYIGKGENKNLLSVLNEIRFRLDEARSIIYQLYDLEKGMK